MVGGVKHGEKMKKLFLALLLSLIFASPAAAMEVRAGGEYIVEALWMTNPDFTEDGSGVAASGVEQKFNVWQRLRTQFEFIANENLRGVLATEIGAAAWGQPGLYELGDSVAAIDIRRMWLEYNWPDTETNVKAGFIGMEMPNAIAGGDAVLNEEVATLVVSSRVNEVLSLQGGFLRPSQAGTNSLSQVDGWFVTAPIEWDGAMVEPYALVAYAGKGPGNNTLAATVGKLEGMFAPGDTGVGDFVSVWGGLALTVDALDPFVLKADVVYGSKDSSAARQNDMHGWFVDAGLSYTGFSSFTPTISAIWSSGEDDDLSNGSERMPQLVSDFSFGTFFFDGTQLMEGTLQSPGAQLGFWAVMLSLEDIRLVPRHVFEANLLYVQGTNDRDLAGATRNWVYGRTLTTEDSFLEADFNTVFNIMDGLDAHLELSYIWADWDTSVWGHSGTADAAKVDFGLVYEF